MKCLKCGNELQADAKFCDRCGEKVVPAVVCPRCGYKMEGEAAFCENCGASLTNSLPPSVPPKPKKIKKKALLAVLGCFTAAAAVGAGIFAAAQLLRAEQTDYALYLKDGNLWSVNLTDNTTMQVSEQMLEPGNQTFPGHNNQGSEPYITGFVIPPIESYITLSSKSGRVFYPDWIASESEDKCVELYCRDLDNPEEEPIQVARDVQFYYINEDGSRIVYTTPDGVSYWSNLEREEEIGHFYAASEDISKVCYTDEDGSLYVWEVAKDEAPLKIADGVTSVRASDNLSTICYSTDQEPEGGWNWERRNYYQYREESGSRQMAQDVSNIYRIYDSGEVFYDKMEDLMEETIKDGQYVTKTRTLGDELESFYYFDGEREYLVAQDYYLALCAKDIPVAVISFKERPDDPDASNRSVNPSIFADGKLTSLSLDNGGEVESFVITRDGSSATLQLGSELYIIPIADGEPGEPELCATEVATSGFRHAWGWNSDKGYQYDLEYAGSGGGSYDFPTYDPSVGIPAVYYKETEDGKPVLYYGEERVAIVDDYAFYEPCLYQDGVLYVRGEVRNILQGEGGHSLYFYKNGQIETIADDVAIEYLAPEGQILYLELLDSSDCTAPLYMYQDGETVMVEEEVNYLFWNIYDEKGVRGWITGIQSTKASGK